MKKNQADPKKIFRTNTIRPYPIRRCFRCGRKTKVHTNDPRKLDIDPQTKRSPVYCRICWLKLPAANRRAYEQDNFVTLN